MPIKPPAPRRNAIRMEQQSKGGVLVTFCSHVEVTFTDAEWRDFQADVASIRPPAPKPAMEKANV